MYKRQLLLLRLLSCCPAVLLYPLPACDHLLECFVASRASLMLANARDLRVAGSCVSHSTAEGSRNQSSQSGVPPPTQPPPLQQLYEIPPCTCSSTIGHQYDRRVTAVGPTPLHWPEAAQQLVPPLSLVRSSAASSSIMMLALPEGSTSVAHHVEPSKGRSSRTTFSRFSRFSSFFF